MTYLQLADGCKQVKTSGVT